MHKNKKKIIDIFYFYAGVSVSASSIILSEFLISYSIEDMLKMFKDISYNIFSIPYKYRIKCEFSLLYAKYSDR